MSEEVVRQTRSQKRALERDGPSGQQDGKKARLERGADAGGEVKATIKVEVQAKDQPVDMSTTKGDVKQERDSPSPDVIVLSDNEPSSPRVNGVNHVGKGMDTELLMRSTPKERERIIKQLKEELRLEEARLVLLKKLRQSQIQKESTAPKTTGPSVATPPPLVRGSMATTKGSLQLVSGRTSGTVIPPPLVRGGQQVSSKLGLSGTQIVMPPLVRGAQVHGQQQQHATSGPPPLLLAPRAAVPNVQIQGQRIIQQGLIRVANVPSASVLVNIPQSPSLKGSTLTQAGTGVGGATDSPASRQAAAKLALRKQLEKTLLEIPPPKPAAPDLNFLPSAANNEFIYLVGLEEVVQNLLETLGKSPATPVSAVAKEPYTCAQCKTDFTCRWRHEKSGSILCEQCMASNQKRALKAEHTSRLKAAFVKALQQEQEMEQRILQQQAASPTSHSTSTSSSTPSSSSAMKVDPQALVAQQMKQARNSSLHIRGVPIERQHSNIKQSTGQLSRVVQPAATRGIAHTFPSSSQLQSAVAAAGLVGTPGKHTARAGTKAAGSRGSPSASAWRKQRALSTGVTMAYVNPSLSMHKASSAVERQREYLLDMIPSRSISQTANTWK
uniref:GATA zinc finger domain containing 2A n=1 Tax=Paramormyrops kingsleyae TaxID=1676925 RepID=A0A3B3SFM9_9TELE|nr:transcriptional repressor p66-alpha-like isoform X1 [Paramormyrops kingsleyae]XP_023653958.1 transcriptional repressor p66-alpha-like isoform X1 [Paramormyrops kingsleyae]XP_023653959.1 transcriptional repressor p66-alpha-like isoform X1 [Paramormyrops kingsleyae]